MSRFYQALEQLKKDLQALSTSSLVVNLENLEDHQFSQKNFVDLAILPEGIQISDYKEYLVASEEDAALYSANVLQAVWNIAHYASMNFLLAYYYKSYIAKSLSYMDVTYTPKIFNESTFKIGLALQRFFSEILVDELTTQLSEDQIDAIRAISDLLNTRMAVYQIHKAENITKNRELLTFRFNVSAKVQEYRSNFDALLYDLEAEIQDLRVLMPQALSHQASDLQSLLESIQIKYQSISQKKDEIIGYLTNFQRLVAQTETPNNISFSPFLLCLTLPQYAKDVLIKEWISLYNTKAPSIDTEDCKTTLDLETVEVKTYIENSVASLTISFENIEHQLRNCIEDVNALANYEAVLASNVVNLHIMEQNDALLILQTKQLGAIEEHIDAYQQTLTRAKEFRKQVLDIKILMQKHLLQVDAIYPVPEPKIASHRPQFAAVQAHACTALEGRIAILNGLAQELDEGIDNFSAELNQITDERAKATEQGRRDKLHEVQQIIEDKSERLEREYRPVFVRAQTAWSLHMQQTLSAMNEVHELYHERVQQLECELSALSLEMEQSTAAIAIVAEQQAQRRQHLLQAKTQLSRYQAILLEYEGIYIPADRIPLVDLHLYLECTNQETLATINAVYKEQEKGSSWWGLNKANLKNKSDYYKNYLLLREIQYGWELILPLIGQKLAIIELELSLTEAGEPPVSDFLITPNLWTLMSALSELKEQIAPNEEELSRLQSDYNIVYQERANRLEQLEQPVFALEKAVAITDLELKIHIIDFELTNIIKDTYELEYKLAEVQQAQQGLQNISTEMDSKSIPEALAYYQANREVILHSNVDWMMTHKDNPHMRSGSEIMQAIETKIKEQEEAYAHVNTLIDDHDELPGAITIGISDLNKSIDSLKVKKAQIESDLQASRLVNRNFMVTIRNKKGLLLTHNQLISLRTVIQSKFADIINDIPLQYENNDVRRAYITGLEDLINTRLPLLNQVNNLQNPEMQQLHTELCLMAEKLKLEYAKLRLVQIDIDNKILIKRFPVKTKEQRDHLVADIDAINERDDVFISTLDFPLDAFIGELLPVVKAQRVEMNFKYEQIKDENFAYGLPDELKEVMFAREYEIRLQIISAKYFGTETMRKGIFPDYLAERRHTYFFSDCLKSLAAIFLGYWGYQPDYCMREDYVNQDLNQAFIEYQDAEECDKEAYYQELIEMIDSGQERFKPRVRHGSGYEASLYYKLELMRHELEPVHELLDKFEASPQVA